MKLCIWPVWELREGPLLVHLMPAEGLIMLALLAHREVTMDLLMDVLWPDPDDMPDIWYRSTMVRMSWLRSKLLLFGWTIACRQGFGWRLEEPPREERLAA